MLAGYHEPYDLLCSQNLLKRSRNKIHILKNIHIKCMTKLWLEHDKSRIIDLVKSKYKTKQIRKVWAVQACTVHSAQTWDILSGWPVWHMYKTWRTSQASQSGHPHPTLFYLDLEISEIQYSFIIIII